MNAIGIDPSLSGLAVCVFGVDTCHETVLDESPPPTTNTLVGRLDRYKAHAAAVRDWLLPHTPATVCLEGYSMGSKGRATLTLAEFGHCLRSQLLLIDCRVVEVAPTQLKKFATGKGQCKKAQVVSSLSRRYNREFATDDAADAYGLARLCACVIGVIEPTTKFEESIAADVGVQLVMEDESCRNSKYH